MANSILGKGIGYLVQKQFLDWKRIEKDCKTERNL